MIVLFSGLFCPAYARMQHLSYVSVLCRCAKRDQGEQVAGQYTRVEHSGGAR
jgi:hypothetical protein